MERIERIRESGGWLDRYRHSSERCQCDMQFSVYLPPAAEQGPVPALYWLSGLTCNDDNFRVKAGAQRYAAELGLALIIPDTSPRGTDVPDEPERYDLGQGAGFYVNASQPPWATHYQMYDYIVAELPALVERELPLIPGVRSVSGHSMGGHGALVVGLRNPGRYRSVSAFAPICNPTATPWGQTCFDAYLGADSSTWEDYDATCLLRSLPVDSQLPPLLIDQGDADEFLQQGQLLPEALRQACAERGAALELRIQQGYDHSYHFIASFIGEHLAWHAAALMADPRSDH